MPDTLFAFLSI